MPRDLRSKLTAVEAYAKLYESFQLSDFKNKPSRRNPH